MKTYKFLKLEIFKFKTDDKIIDYISLMGNILVPHAIIIGKKIYTFHSSSLKIY